MVRFIDEHKARWGIEPICTVLTTEFDLQIAPGTYYAFKSRPVSARAKRDVILKAHIMRIHTHPRMRVYGVRKIHAQLSSEGLRVARTTIERLCRLMGGARGGTREIPTHHETGC